MLFATFTLLSLVASTSAIGAFIPKFRPPTPPVRPQEPPKFNFKPNNNKPDLQPAKPAPAQEQVQANNVGGLNNLLKKTEDLIDLMDIGKDIADAILGTTQSTTVKGRRKYWKNRPLLLIRDQHRLQYLSTRLHSLPAKATLRSYHPALLPQPASTISSTSSRRHVRATRQAPTQQHARPYRR